MLITDHFPQFIILKKMSINYKSCFYYHYSYDYFNSDEQKLIDDVDKTRKKAGMIFASGFNCRKVNPFVYIKFWYQACLPSLLYGVELFTVTPTLIEKFERCQMKISFLFPNLPLNICFGAFRTELCRI